MDLKSILLVLHVIIAISLIGFILIQHGKGADAGAAFGGGSSSTVFGSRGSSSFLSRTTAYLATLFFVLSFTLYFMAVQSSQPGPKLDATKQSIIIDPKQPEPKKAGSEKTPTPKDTSKSDSESKADKGAAKSDASKKEALKSDTEK